MSLEQPLTVNLHSVDMIIFNNMKVRANLGTDMELEQIKVITLFKWNIVTSYHTLSCNHCRASHYHGY